MFFCAVTLFSQDYTVDYIDGIVDIQKDRSWLEVFTGDIIDSGATLKLGNDSIIELSKGPTRLVLSQAGIYSLKNLEFPSARNNEVGSMITHKLKVMVGNTRTGKSAVMGVRASDAAEEPNLEWMTSESAEFIQSGKMKLEQADIPGAEEDFRQALSYAQDFSEEQELETARFYLGYTNTLLEKSGPALKILSQIRPDTAQDFYNELYILRGNLLIESLAFDNAIQWLETFKPDKASVEIQQTIALLTGIAYQGQGNSQKARSMFLLANELEPGSETGVIAKKLAADL